jgi:putative peptidoglycan lipid II flippase
VVAAGAGVSGLELGAVGTGRLVVLGAGSTVAVAVHAGVLWWGARRAGIDLRPRAGWREPEVRRILSLAVPSLGSAGLSAARNFGLLVAANRLRGGVVAFQAALNVFHLPVALAAHPVSVALLPRLSRQHRQGDDEAFRTELVGGVRLASLVALPAAAACVALAWPVARALAFGEMADPVGVALLAASIAALGAGVAGECGYLVATTASYARDDARTPLLGAATRFAVPLVGIVVAFLVPADRSVLVVIGVAVSVGSLAAAVQVGAALARRLPEGGAPLLRPLARTLLASTVAAGVGLAVAEALPAGSRLTNLAGLALATVAGGAVCLGAQRLASSASDARGRS